MWPLRMVQNKIKSLRLQCSNLVAAPNLNNVLNNEQIFLGYFFDFTDQLIFLFSMDDHLVDQTQSNNLVSLSDKF